MQGMQRPVSSCLEWVVDCGCGCVIACVGGRMCGDVLLWFASMAGLLELFAAMKWVSTIPLVGLFLITR